MTTILQDNCTTNGQPNVMALDSNRGPIFLPCLNVILVPAEKVRANNYNPNNVPRNNMELLLQSILDNGFCFPIVTIYDEEVDEYVIVDGFHRYTILKDWLEVKQIPVVVLQHDIKKRMAATVQFNRARGVHQVELMGDLVKALVEQGATDEEIAKHLGMEMEEVYRLKQITGIAELFKNQPYSKAWEMVEVADDV
jgi:ParB-like chromosome segregation protein Spo0J